MTRNVILVLLCATSISAQSTPQSSVPVILDEIGKLESVRDPKCYATASRLEDFIYGTPLAEGARFEKISLQKALITSVWSAASTAAVSRNVKSVDAALLRETFDRQFRYAANPDGSWTVTGASGAATTITARDKRQYGSVAYALRAILAVQQDALLSGKRLVPLDPPAVEMFKEAIDLVTLAAMQHADRAARIANAQQITAPLLTAGWKHFIAPAAAASREPRLTTKSGGRFDTILAVVDKKIEAFSTYNSISMPVFLRNLQVYFARHRWPADPEEGEGFRNDFTETMIAFTSDVLLESEKVARKRGHNLIRVEDVAVALQVYEPHEVNRYEDVIYFPRLPRRDQITIEAYDIDAFRDPGIHWVYLAEALRDPGYKGTMEPDPFAAELLVEGTAQFGVLALRVAGTIASEESSERLSRAHLRGSLQRIQTLLDRHTQTTAPRPASSGVKSAAAGSTASAGTWFTDVTAASGVDFVHHQSDWLSRMIRSYTVKDETTARLAVPPAFGGSGVAAEDIDADGDADILLLGGAGNRLYLNDRGTFRDVTSAAGLDWKRADGTPGEPRQPIIADFDNDGLQDILITYANDAHRLYRNLGASKFEDVTKDAGLGGEGLVGGPATALDFDEDGLLDVFIGYFGDYVHSELPTLSRRNSNALPDRLLRNRGGMKFEDVTSGSGVANLGWAQAAGHLDFDGDGREDILLGNDFGINAWYRNLGNGKFEDASARYGVDKPSYTMSLGIADLNRDQHPDVYVANIVVMDKDQKYVLPDETTRMRFDPAKMANMRVVEANDLFTSRSGSDGVLQSYEQSDAVGRGASSTGWSWDADFFDFDNDGDEDLYCVNGMNEYAVYTSVNPYYTDPAGTQRATIMPVAEKELNVFFVNEGGKLNEESKKSGADHLGNSRSVAYLDWDQDGDLDMALNNFNDAAVLYRNNSEQRKNHSLSIRLEGDPAKGVTRDAIGAQITVDSASNKGMWREVFSTTGYLSVHPKEQHFGLGRDASASISVLWPNGERQKFEKVAAGHSYALRQGDSELRQLR